MRRVILSIAILGIAWAIGLIVFVATLPDSEGDAAVKADGIVVYTGLGGARVATAMALMGDGAGSRLLISGVNPEISRDELAKLWPGEIAAFDCCVDLGLEARSTEGNALEVRDWARDHGFGSLILVTSDYHMPRALLETRAKLPDIAIIAHPVESGLLGANGKPETVDAWRKLALEYTKFLAVRVRTLAPAR